MAIERVVPDELEADAKVLREHLERYELAASLLEPDDHVIDAACGSGYGSALLVRRCRRVVGYDLCAETVAYARRRYPADNLEFHTRDLTAEPLPECDVVVSFETIEHLPSFELFLAGARASARRQIILSTPIIPTRHFNEFHVHDFTRGQIEEVMRPWRPAYCCIQAGQFGVWAFTREAEPDNPACTLLRRNLHDQQEQSARFEQEQERLIGELRTWVADLEKGKTWLEGQWRNWERVAAEREGAVHDLLARLQQAEGRRAGPARRALSLAAGLWARLAARRAG